MENSCSGMDSRWEMHGKLTWGWIHGEIHGKLAVGWIHLEELHGKLFPIVENSWKTHWDGLTLEKSMENSLGWIYLGELHAKLFPIAEKFMENSPWRNPWKSPLGWPPALQERLRQSRERGNLGEGKVGFGVLFSCSDSVGNKLILSQIPSLCFPDGIS